MDLFRASLLLMLAVIQTVLAGDGGQITLSNFTPYPWNRVHQHSYHMDWKFPERIGPGETYLVYVEWFYQDYVYGADAGAEAVYKIMGAPSEQHFVVEARQSTLENKNLQVRFQDDLCSVNNPKNSVINLGWVHDGAVNFILSSISAETYVSTNPPVAWMQATLNSIASKSLRQISLPASHDSGSSEITRALGGIESNSITQSRHMYSQLKNGARWFDIRPMFRKGIWSTWHGTIISGHGITSLFGTFGREILDIVKDINHFTREYPGELIVLDISRSVEDGADWFEHLTPKLWQSLFEVLGGIEHLYTVSTANFPEDLTTLPMVNFIQPGSKSAVLIRVPFSAPRPAVFNVAPKKDQKRPSAEENTKVTRGLDGGGYSLSGDSINTGDNAYLEEHLQHLGGGAVGADYWDYPNGSLTISQINAFIPDYRLPYTGSFSNTNSPNKMIRDQLRKLSTLRRAQSDEMHMSFWTLTQSGAQVASRIKENSILAMAAKAKSALLQEIWRSLTPATYPNLIMLDDWNEWQGQVVAVCMAINANYAQYPDHYR